MPILRDLLARNTRGLKHLPSLGGRSTASSVVVTPERSLQVASVYGAVRILSEAVASLPTGLYKRTPGYRTRIESHRLADLLLEQPNPAIDAGEYWRTAMGWMMLRGNGYVFVERNGSGDPKHLWPVSPASVKVKRRGDGGLAYELTPDEDSEYVPVKKGYTTKRGEMLHYRAFGLGTEGLSPIGMARQQIGISFATTSYIGGFFARDASPGGVVSVDGELTETQYSRLTEQWRSLHEGFDSSHKLAVLEGGAKWEKTTLSPADAQFLEVYKLSRQEIAAIYGVPPHMLGDLERATFSNIEQQSLEFVMHSLRPWLVRLERVTRSLLGADEYLRFNVNGLLRGDITARTAAYAQGRQWGWLSANDVRREEDMDPIDGGDEYLVPLNMLPAGATPTQRAARARQIAADGDPRPSTARAAQAPVEARPAWHTRLQDVLVEYFDEQLDAVPGELAVRSRPGVAVRGLLGADQAAAWDELLADKLTGPFGDIVAEFAREVATELGGTFNPTRVVRWIRAAAARQARNINLTTWQAIERALAAWEDAETEDGRTLHQVAADVVEERGRVDAALIALGVVNAIGNFGRTEGARQAGARTKTWIVTSSDPRASHARMNGETVPLSENFSNGCAWPGDPDGGADEVANCMCAVEFTTGE
ncbi:phage portal protein [Cellulosimicrobium funkei]|uniref:phage portal protein n=1 Tax=Cellulosimicrobium funkei TaxID=264251 RepID=UPI0037574939